MSHEESVVLAVESSCDETAVALMRGVETLLGSEVASQMEEHARYGGVVPELASRNHLLTLRPLVERTLERSGIGLDRVDAVAGTVGPGLAPALMVGAAFAKALAVGLAKPFYAVNHIEGHLLSPYFGEREIPEHVGLVVSGGHTLLVRVRGFGRYELLGRTLDDAAGEAFDKVAKLLGLPYPGGPAIESLAATGRAGACELPRSMLNSGDFMFSFSGLKTAVRYLLEKNPEAEAADVAREFQAAVIDVLVQKTLRAAQSCELREVAVSGGVGCNRALQGAMIERLEEEGMRVRFAANWLSTDNAAMIASVAAWSHRTGRATGLDTDIRPGLAFDWFEDGATGAVSGGREVVE